LLPLVSGDRIEVGKETVVCGAIYELWLCTGEQGGTFIYLVKRIRAQDRRSRAAGYHRLGEGE